MNLKQKFMIIFQPKMLLRIRYIFLIWIDLGTSQSGGGSTIGSNISSCESLTTLLSRDLLLQKTRPNNNQLVFNLSDNNFQQSIGASTTPITSATPLTLNSYIQSSCEQNLSNRLRHQPYLETCFS